MPERCFATFNCAGTTYRYLDLAAFLPAETLSQAPYSLRVVMENAARHRSKGWMTAAALAGVFERIASGLSQTEALALGVSRVLLPDSSGIPLLIDLAGLRSALAREGHDYRLVEPRIPVDLVVDHSLIVERYGARDAIAFNVAREYERNGERYRFLRWAKQAFSNLRVVPPGMGIVHQVHLERLARVIVAHETEGGLLAHPEFVLGGDSHTPMVNGLGVLGWGVGGVEAEAAILGQPYVMTVPQVTGVRLQGTLPPGTTTTDLVLTVTQVLRQQGVVGQFVEFTGDGLSALSVPDRATIANMAPEYGATAAYFPIDTNTLVYLAQTRCEAQHIAFVEAYARAAHLFRDVGSPEPSYWRLVEIDLSAIEPSVSGPRRPQDRLALWQVAADFREKVTLARDDGGFGVAMERAPAKRSVRLAGGDVSLAHGSIAIAAITACTNTSNPSVMIAAGLLARKAAARGMRPPPYVKTSMAPGSRVVSDYLETSGLLADLETLGFHVVGYGCTTCSGKSGPLVDGVGEAIDEANLVAAAIVSSNRNFEGRIHKQVRAAYLASPPLVVAYALAGRVNIDMTREPLGRDDRGRDVFLSDIWPTPSEIEALLALSRDPRVYRRTYAGLFDGTAEWQALEAPSGPLFQWDKASTYILEPPFLRLSVERAALGDRIDQARLLGLYGDQLNTDHIAPAGEILQDSEAGRYLQAQGVAPSAFNAFTMRRGNHDVMVRGAFAHARIANLLVPERQGGWTRLEPAGALLSIFDAAARLRSEGHPALIMGGRDYGMGSSRDWAAKGPFLLGVRAVIAQSFERIHRSNLIALGILPLVFEQGQSAATLGLTGFETFSLSDLQDALQAGTPVKVTAQRGGDAVASFNVALSVVAEAEVATLRAGGIFARFFRELTAQRSPISEHNTLKC